MSDLLRELQEAHRESPSWRLFGLCHQAADRIAALEAQLAEAERRKQELEREVTGLRNSYFEERKARIALEAAPPAPVQDTWFTDRALPVMAMSGDAEDNRVLRLHFRRQVTDDDRKAMCDALNLHQASLTTPPAPKVTEAMKVAAVKAYIAIEGKCRPVAMQAAIEAALQAIEVEK